MTQIELLQRRRNGLPSPRAASGPWPKRLLTNRWLWVFVIMTAVYAACLAWQYQTLTTPVQIEGGGEAPGLNSSAIRDAAKLAFPTLAFWIVAYVLLDRLRPQRLLAWWLALGWGGAVSTAASLHLNTWAAQQMQIAGQDPSTGARSAVFVAPFVEEATKASVLFLIAIAYRYRLVSKLNGIVLAGLSAAGFAFTENIIYYARAIVYSSMTIGTGDPEAAVEKIVMLRGVWLAFGHPLFTTMTGIGLLVGLRAQSKLVRVLAPLVGFCAASFGHMVFNTGASLVTDEQQQLIVYFVMVLPLVLAVLVWVLRQLLVESRRLRDRLTDFVRTGWLQPGDVYAFSRGRSRWRATIIAASRGWRCLVATMAMQRAVTELAYLRDAQVHGVIDAAGHARARELLERIEVLRPSAVADPRGQRLQRLPVQAWAASLRRLVRWPGRRHAANQAPTTGGAPIGSPMFSPVDPRWGPPHA